MPIGIRPTIDFAFKFLFGNPANADLLIHLLNAVLQFATPIVEVIILNPFNEKEFDTDKLSVVDIKARDSQGKWYVIEVQTTLASSLANRLVYYTCATYCGQLQEGEGYSELRPAITICFLTQSMFPEVAAGHLHFELFDVKHAKRLGDQLQLHFVELPKYDLQEDMIGQAEALQQWVFFLGRADEYEPGKLRRLLPNPEFHKATRVLEMIARSPELRMLYDDRAKEELDRFSELQDARSEGHAEGRAEGERRGRDEGEARGVLIGRIALLQQLLGEPTTQQAEYSDRSLSELQQLADQLQQQFQQQR